MKTIVLTALLVFCLAPVVACAQRDATNHNSESKLCYDPCVVELHGILVLLPEQNTYLYIKEKVIHVYALKLDNPVDVVGDPKSEVNIDSFKDIRELQLAFDPTKMNLDKFVGKDVSVTGTLEESVTIHQYTKVYLAIGKIRLAQQ